MASLPGSNEESIIQEQNRPKPVIFFCRRPVSYSAWTWCHRIRGFQRGNNPRLKTRNGGIDIKEDGAQGKKTEPVV